MSSKSYWLKTYVPNFKKLLSSFQIETYLLIILPITWILLSTFFERSILLQSKRDLVLWSFFYGGSLIKIGLLFLYIYLYFRLIILFGNWLGRKIFKDVSTPKIDLKQFLLSIIYIMVAIGLYNLVLALSLTQLSDVSSRASMIAASQLFMSMDKGILGFYPELYIQKFSISSTLDCILIQSYCNLPLFFSIVLIGLLLFNKTNFRKFLLAIFIAPFIAMPLWYALPAVTPNEMYRENMFSLHSLSVTQKQYEEAVTSKRLEAYLNLLDKSVEKPQQKHPLVSTNPSMHVAWGAIITYFSIILWWPLGFIFIPWLIFNMLATLYTLQHYAVDLPSGLVCATIAIVLTSYLFKFEKKYYTGKHSSLYFINIIQNDIRFLKNKLKRTSLKLYNLLSKIFKLIFFHNFQPPC